MNVKTSNLTMAKYLNDILVEFYDQLEKFDNGLSNRSKLKIKENGKKDELKKEFKKKKNRVLVIIDGPNSLGKDYNDKLNLKEIRDFAYKLDKNAKLIYATKISENRFIKDKASTIGYRLITRHKDIDHIIKDEIRERLKAINPPNLIIFGTKDGDYTGFIKNIREEYSVKIKLVVSSNNGFSDDLKSIFSKDDIFYCSFKQKSSTKFLSKKVLHGEEQYEFCVGNLGDPISYTTDGKVCLIYRGSKFKPNIGETWICSIKEEKDTVIILNPIKKIR